MVLWWSFSHRLNTASFCPQESPCPSFCELSEGSQVKDSSGVYMSAGKYYELKAAAPCFPAHLLLERQMGFNQGCRSADGALLRDI